MRAWWRPAMCVLALAVSCCAGAGAAAGEDWPHWRGPRGDAISQETEWTWNWPASGPPRVWSAEIGIGFSAVAVAEGRVIATGHVDGEEVVWCLDAATGRVLWSRRDKAALVDNLHEGGPAASPTIADGRVFVVGREGRMLALDVASGRVLWEAALQQLAEVKLPEWGFSCSPLVLDGQVFIDAGRTVALDAASGRVLWKTDKFRPGYGTPCSFEHGGERLLGVFNNDGLMVVRAASGQIAARHPWQTPYATNSTTPIYRDGKFFISSGYDRGCGLLKFTGEAFESVYENRRMRNHMSTCVLLGGYLYGIDGNSENSRAAKLTCMAWDTAEVAWAERGFGCGSLLAAGDKLLVLGDAGELSVVRASPERCEVLARAAILEGRCWSMPVLSHGLVYARNAAGTLVCVDLRGR